MHLGKISLLTALLAIVWSRSADARLNGIEAAGCSGCHRGGTEPTVTVTTDVPSASPGQKVTITVAISTTNGAAGGFFLPKPTLGTLTAGAGEKLWADGALSHSTPGRATGNQVIFQIVWTAPTTPASGGVDFPVYAISANGNGSNSGDMEGFGFTSIAYGCPGTKYYGDRDGDSYGMIESGWTMNCTTPMYYAARPGDCNDSEPKAYPGAAEVCDGKDNDCNGMIDENLASTVLCEDKDGDGHGIMGGMTRMGCVPNLKGFGACDGDCNDNDPKIHIGATEICNGLDDNCDGKIDENARPTCGEGWCRRYGLSCQSNICTPGPPRKETCNLFDDDCDGVIDNGTDIELCGDPSLGCKEGYCKPIDTGSPGSTDVTAGTSGVGSGTGDTTGSTVIGGPGTSGSGSGSGGAGGTNQAAPGEIGCAMTASPRRGSPLAALSLALVYALRRRRRLSSRPSRDAGLR